MIWIILGIVFAICLIYNFIPDIKEDKFAFSIMSIVLGSLFGFLVNFALWGFRPYFLDKQALYDIEIVSLRDSSETSGQFFLGTGSVRNQRNYFTYFKINENSYKLTNTDVYRSIITEKNEKPKLIVYGYRMNMSFWLCFLPEDIETNFEYVVPKGTIVKEFKVN